MVTSSSIRRTGIAPEDDPDRADHAEEERRQPMQAQALADQHRAEQRGEAGHDGEERTGVEARWCGAAPRTCTRRRRPEARRARDSARTRLPAAGSSPSRQATIGAIRSTASTKRTHISTAGSRPWVMCSPRGKDVEMMTIIRKASACACAWPVRADPSGCDGACGVSCPMPHTIPTRRSGNSRLSGIAMFSPGSDADQNGWVSIGKL